MKKIIVYKLVLTAIMSAVALILMFLEFPLTALIPGFIKFDFSDLPGLLVSISSGPLWGALVCLLKNLLHIPFGSTGGIGEIANFFVGATYVIYAGVIYRLISKKRLGIFVGGLAGSIAMAVVAFPVNYCITYPFYTKFMPLEAIISAYRAIYPGTKDLAHALLIFNTPFNVAKGLILTLIAVIAYPLLEILLKRIEENIKT